MSQELREDLGEQKHGDATELEYTTEGNRLQAAQDMTEAEFLAAEKKLTRKLDLRLLACVWVIFVMNYLDRVRLMLRQTPLNL